jgi:hypothetical protein
MELSELRDFARRYTGAWCSGDAARVAEHFSPHGSLTVNDGAAAIGRRAITEAAQGFMSAFPDLEVSMDGITLATQSVEEQLKSDGGQQSDGGESSDGGQPSNRGQQSNRATKRNTDPLALSRAEYRWTLTGTNTGPGGTGHRVRVSGFELWRIGEDGLIAESHGHFNSAAYQRQLEGGAE